MFSAIARPDSASWTWMEYQLIGCMDFLMPTNAAHNVAERADDPCPGHQRISDLEIAPPVCKKMRHQA